ncbi:hypothetical protein EDC01DRAFT_614167 [Geopyxis carbonaria]|nr:hypothetical protein EDC01DRAFT_614167 [Geopyxis carbonaria]
MGVSASLLPPLPTFSVSKFTLTDAPPSTTADASAPAAAADAAVTPTTSATPDPQVTPTDGAGEWQTVKRQKKAKKEKKRGDKNYPEFVISPQKLKRPVQTNDLQGLVLWLAADAPAPQWLLVRHKPEIRRTVVVMVPGLTPNMFDGSLALKEDYFPTTLSREKLPPCLADMADMFTHMWPMRSVGDQKHNRLHSPLTSFLTSAVKTDAGPKSGSASKRIKISDVIMTLDELVENEYVLHTSQLVERRRLLNLEESDSDRAAMELRKTEGWVETDLSKPGNEKDKNEAGAVTEGRDIYSIDCEMCMVGESFELTRISIVNWDGDTIYDELVKPDKPITDYVTAYSGITEEMLAPVTTTLHDVQQHLLNLLNKDSILVGQSLNSDLNAIRYAHPFIIDTSCIYHHARGPPYKASLKYLSKKFLHREVQGSAAGHNSIEDALACLDLLKLKLERGHAFGTADEMREPIYKRLARAQAAGARKFALVDNAESTARFGAHATAALAAADDAAVVTQTAHCARGARDEGVPQMDFTFAHLRGLAAARGIELPGAAIDKVDIDAPFPDAPTDPAKPELVRAVAESVQRVKQIYEALPPCTALVVFSGIGDTRRWKRLGEMQRRFREEFKVRKWDQLSVQWTDTEEQAWRKEYNRARSGVGFMVVK